MIWALIGDDDRVMSGLLRSAAVGRLVASAAVAAVLGAVVVGDAPLVPGGSHPAGAGLPPMPPSTGALAGSPPAAQAGSSAGRAVPAKLIVVRTGSIDSLSAGVLVQRIARESPAVTPAALAAAVPSSWMSITADTVRFGAALQLTAGTRLDVNGVRTVQLVGGDDPRSGAYLATGRGRIRLRGVTVTSIDPTSGQPVGPAAAGRPFIKVSDGGSLAVIDSTITDLGAQPSTVTAGEPAVAFGHHSTGVLTRTTLARSSIGLSLNGSQAVKLRDVTVRESAGTGIVLRGDRATVLSGVRAEHNGDDGLLVTGESTGRPITGVTTTGNRFYGVSVSGQSQTEISNLALSGDQAGGLELNRVSDSHVHNITITDQPIGMFMHVNSTNLALDAVTVSGGHAGVVVDKSTVGLRFTDSTIANARLVGMAYDGRDGLLQGLTVNDCATAVRVDHGAGSLAIDRLRISGGENGLVTSNATAAILVRDLSADGVGNDAIRTESPGMQVLGGQIRGGHTGMDLRAPTTVSGTRISLASIGIHAGSDGLVALDGVTIEAETVGVAAEQGSAVTLHNSVAHALHATRGDVRLSGVNDLNLPPLNLLGVIGLPLILLALVLEFLHLLGQIRRKRSRSREYLRRWEAMATAEFGLRSTGATVCTCDTPTAPDSSTAETCDACVAV
jgi:copper-binding protein NosD